MREKIILSAFLGIFVLAASGCVKKTEAPSAISNPAPAVKKNDNQPPASPTFQEEAMPKATGKVDDLVNAVNQEADNEKTTLSEEEAAASDLAKDSEEINNLENSYDENEL